jgi:hypothetical protein
MVGYTAATATPLQVADISTTNINVLVVIVSTKCILFDNSNPDPYIKDTFESTLTLCNNNIKIIRLLFCYNYTHHLNLLIDQVIADLIQQTGMPQEKVTVVVEEW